MGAFEKTSRRQDVNEMTRGLTRRGLKVSIGFLLAMQCLALSGCKPWTVRPIDAANDAHGSSQYADPAAYVDSIWTSKLVPTVLNSAVDAKTLLNAMSSSLENAERQYGRNSEGGAWYFNVKGEGRVLAVDGSSSSGLLQIRVLPQDRTADVSIQIGPVLRGTALRDSTDLIAFSNFVNQLQFADVADHLNIKARETVLSSIDRKAIIGKIVRFAGSFEAESATQPLIKNLVPVELAVGKSQ